MKIQSFYEPKTFTLTYVVFDEATRDAVIIDPVLDYDPLPSLTSTDSVEQVAAFVEEHKLRIHYVLETHAHADHLSSSQWLKRRFDSRVAIGERITEVQETFKDIFDLGADFKTDGSQFDRLLKDGEVFDAGSLRIEVINTPGHTPACVTYKIGDAIFTGDALFIEDQGTGRCDFPRGSAEALYDSIHERLYKLPDETRVFVGHDYQPDGREVRFETTLGEEKRKNVQLRAETPREEFIRFRSERDSSLAQPKLLFPSVQVNVDAGRMPKAHGNGKRYIHVPLNLFRSADDVGEPIGQKK